VEVFEWDEDEESTAPVSLLRYEHPVNEITNIYVKVINEILFIIFIITPKAFLWLILLNLTIILYHILSNVTINKVMLL
jgi:hypothetical protein